MTKNKTRPALLAARKTNASVVSVSSSSVRVVSASIISVSSASKPPSFLHLFFIVVLVQPLQFQTSKETLVFPASNTVVISFHGVKLNDAAVARASVAPPHDNL